MMNIASSNTKKNRPLLQNYLELACAGIPAVESTIRRYGDMPLCEYLKSLTFERKPAYQSLDDISEVSEEYAAPLLGHSIARRVAEDIARHPVVLTANHHGVDYFAQSIQGSLIFSLGRFGDQVSATTIPIFAGGGVPLNNVTYPQGILIYHSTLDGSRSYPLKIPVFPNKMRSTMVSFSESINDSMVQRTEKLIDRLVKHKSVPDKIATTLYTILQKDYLSSQIQQLSGYSQQSVVLNSRIWKRLFSNMNGTPELVYLEFEKIVGLLLERDLRNTSSLVRKVLFQPTLRELVLRQLDGHNACWKEDKLKQRLAFEGPLGGHQRHLEGCGTHFFWGVGKSGRRIPLVLEAKDSTGVLLRGRDDYGTLWEFPYSPESILKELKAERLLPSLFTGHLAFTLARGAVCAGGYFQAQYLSNFQKGLVKAMRKANCSVAMTHLVADVPTGVYLSGMAAIMTKPEVGYLVPAGPIEIISGGGIGKSDIERMLTLKVRDAHLAAMIETIPDIPALDPKSSNWKKKLAEESNHFLNEKVIIK